LSSVKGGFAKVSNVDAKTQKARGIFFLQNKSYKVKSVYDWVVPKHLLFDAGYEFGEESLNFPVFARPCPTVPKHGFVDSIICNNAEELNALSNLTFGVENDAELLVTKPVKSSFNAIINGGVITFAPGNDGATSGRGVQYFYINDDPLSKAIGLDDDLLLEGEVPFYEMVFSMKGESRLVQVRSAPGVPRAKDFIPHTITVKKIIHAEGDLLEWEKKMVGIDPLTTVIDHRGGSLSSHYAIHSIINKIPLFTTYCPEIGDVVGPTVESSEINDEDRISFKESFIAGFNSAPYVYRNMNFEKSKNARPILLGILELSLATLHNFSGLSISKDYQLLGVVLGLFVRTTFSVSAGEARHAPTKNGFSDTLKCGNKMESFLKTLPSNREACYNTMFSKKAKDCIDDIEAIYYIFKDITWGGAYGGRKWASCTDSSIQLYNAGVRGDIEEVVSMFNRVINEEHNGGKYLNKIIDVSDFDLAANDPSSYALKKLPKIIDTLHTSMRYMREKEGEWKKTTPFFVELDIEPLPEIKSEGTVSNCDEKETCGAPSCGLVGCSMCDKIWCGKFICPTCHPENQSKIKSVFSVSTKEKIDALKVKLINGMVYTIPLNKSYDCAEIGKTNFNNEADNLLWVTVKGGINEKSYIMQNIPYGYYCEVGKFKVSKIFVNKGLKSAIHTEKCEAKAAANKTNLDLSVTSYTGKSDQIQALKSGIFSVIIENVKGVWNKIRVSTGNNADYKYSFNFPLLASKKDMLTSPVSTTLKSIPLWWTLQNGTKVISKAKLNNLLKNRIYDKDNDGGVFYVTGKSKAPKSKYTGPSSFFEINSFKSESQ
jgi:hypothetical protein